jgi:hypothetical protein
MRAYPIPVQDEMTIELHTPVNGPVDFEIYNMLGALVYTQRAYVDNGRTQLRGLDALQSGIYLVTYAKDGFSEVVKFIK